MGGREGWMERGREDGMDRRRYGGRIGGREGWVREGEREGRR